MKTKAFASLLLFAGLSPVVLTHSFLEKIWANGIEYTAWDPNAGSQGLPYPDDTPSWYTTNAGGGPIKPSGANTYEIICAKGSLPAPFSAPANAGSTLTVKWWMLGQPFPTEHRGPVIDYIAACNGPCADVNPADLNFVKIAEKGFMHPTERVEGYWATNEMIDNNGTWPIQIPAGLKAGEYVIRHELIALHVAFEAIGQGPYHFDGAEFYPQCVSIQVGGSGTKEITGGVGAGGMYRGDELGLAIDIHSPHDFSDYVIPGPALWSGA